MAQSQAWRSSQIVFITRKPQENSLKRCIFTALKKQDVEFRPPSNIHPRVCFLLNFFTAPKNYVTDLQLQMQGQRKFSFVPSLWLYEVCGEALAQEELLYAVYRFDSDVFFTKHFRDENWNCIWSLANYQAPFFLYWMLVSSM